MNVQYYKDSLWRRLIKVLRPFLSDVDILKLQFWYKMGSNLNLTDPVTFCEKLQWLKLFDKKPDYTQLVDKLAVKSFVRETLGEDKYIIPTLGVWKTIDEIDWNSLPNQFVVKSTGDSGGVVICRNKKKFDIKAAVKKLKKMAHVEYSKYNMEYPYKNVSLQYLAEPYISDGGRLDLSDYKFFCFNGKAEYCQLIMNRSIDETIDFFDREWQHQPFIGLIGLSPTAHHACTIQQKPANYEKMLEVADLLSSRIKAPFVRIDLYNVRGKIYFGEITFFPASGMGRFMPRIWDYKLGEMIALPQCKNIDN